MKRFLFVIILLCCSAAVGAFRRDTIPDRAAFDWAVGLDYVFDNSEYSRSSNAYYDSNTLHGIRLSPVAGILIPHGDSVTTHRVRLGVDFFKQAGENLSVGNLIKELQMYYDVRTVFRNGAHFEALAGCFPRSFFLGDYDGPAFDPKVFFVDPNVDGMLFKYVNSDFRTELGLDWLGMFADKEHPARRERFQVLSSGDWRFAGPFHLTWNGVFYHYACSLEELGVVDNHMINPMLEWRPSCWFDKVSVSAGAVLTYQWDRSYEDNPQTPLGFYSIQSMEKWHVALTNKLYWGSDLMPMYDKYGSELYMGRMMFHTRRPDPSVADEITLSYNPHITDWLDVAAYATFDFGSPDSKLGTKFYRGCRQIISLKINLERFTR